MRKLSNVNCVADSGVHCRRTFSDGIVIGHLVAEVLEFEIE